MALVNWLNGTKTDHGNGYLALSTYESDQLTNTAQSHNWGTVLW
jgi:hypothetical protein